MSKLFKSLDQVSKLSKSLSHQVPSNDQVVRIESLREAAKQFGSVLIARTNPSSEQSLAITKLEESLMWAVKGVVLE